MVLSRRDIPPVESPDKRGPYNLCRQSALVELAGDKIEGQLRAALIT